MMEDDYYNHPAVRAYEMQKAVEQARWTRHRQMQNAQKKGQSGAQGRW
jgi:formiminotetrahydrofolate cyclodeaminase